jgi:DNA-directed RNA polymerase subunit RPC12/RpoP
MDAETIASRIHSGDYEECPYCKTVFEWSKMEDERILKDRQPSEFWGATVYETIVIGYVCPECGYKVSF